MENIAMIDKEQFIENFKPFDKEVVLEIIDIFIQEYPERMQELEKNIREDDFDSIRFNAHSLKGVVANFIAPEPKDLAKELEERGKNKETEGNLEVFQELKEKTSILVDELNELRKNYQ